VAEFKQHDDGSISIYSEQEGIGLLRIGGPANPAVGGTSAAVQSQSNFRGVQTVKIPLNNGTANITGGCAIWVNPFQEALLIGLTSLRFATGQDVTFTISVGTGTLSSSIEPKGLSNNLIDSYNYNTANSTPNPNNIDNKGSSGAATRILGVGEAILVTANRQWSTAQITLYADVRKV
jgi:hypothetical protein